MPNTIGAKTYKILTSDDTMGLVLHVRPAAEDKSMLMSHIWTANDALQGHGLAPTRVAQGHRWYLETMEGKGTAKRDTIEDCQAMGKFIAAVHSKCQTSWFEKYTVSRHLNLKNTRACQCALIFARVALCVTRVTV